MGVGPNPRNRFLLDALVRFLPCAARGYYNRPRIASEIAEDCSILLVLFFIFIFFRPASFQCPWADFRETSPHDAVCPEIVYPLYGCSYVPAKNLRGEQPQFR